MVDQPETAGDWARYLKTNWERRGASEYRDWFVAPQGFGDEEAWFETGRAHARMVTTGADPEWMKGQHLLEIGCGAGRLALAFDGAVKSYTGIDISPSMLVEARARCPESDQVRYFESDGLSVPEGALDRDYGLILAVAVFIHCPKSVTERMLTEAYGVLAPGGVLRFQVGGDPGDTKGLPEPEVVETAVENSQEIVNSVTDEQRELIDAHYLGHHFGYDELRTFLEATLPVEVDIYRPEPNNFYATVRKPD